jgi:hypothetical protein
MSRPTGPSPPNPTGSRLTLVGIAALLVTAATIAGGGLALGEGRAGRPQAVAFAAAVCLPGAVAAWIVARLPIAIPARAVAASLAATVLRIVPPLAGLAWLSAGPRDAITADRGGLLVVFYLALLATDILLHMMGSRGLRRPPTSPD